MNLQYFFDVAVFHTSCCHLQHFKVQKISLVPRPLPNFISPIFLHGCEIKSGSGLGTRLQKMATQMYFVDNNIWYILCILMIQCECHSAWLTKCVSHVHLFHCIYLCIYGWYGLHGSKSLGMLIIVSSG